MKMFNILSYVGMNMQAELCLWTLLGFLRTIFDATLFKVNANLKQVWQMTMPPELSMPVQRVLRTMISGVMLVQCFTLYVYLAAYIVLLYPVFLEERPALVLPWLLLAAIRTLLCELTSLALGLGTCLLLGPARPPCIKFVIAKIVSVMPAFYMWILVFSYYNALKVASALKILTAGTSASDPDYGLELAVRRRRTKSLFNENQLRSKLVASLYGERNMCIDEGSISRRPIETSPQKSPSFDTNGDDAKVETNILNPLSATSNKCFESLSNEDWFGNEVVTPRDTDRILEQFVLMMLRIGVHLKKEATKLTTFHMFASHSDTNAIQRNNFNSSTLTQYDADTPPLVASYSQHPPSYLREYPEIFMKKAPNLKTSLSKNSYKRNTKSQVTNNNIDKTFKSKKCFVSVDSNVSKSLTIEKKIHKRIISGCKSSLENKSQRQKVNDEESRHATISEINKQSTTIRDNYSKTLKQAASCDLHSKSSSESINSLIQRMKTRLSKNMRDR